MLDHLHLMNVTGTVGEDGFGMNAHDQLGADEIGKQRIRLAHSRPTGYSKPLGAFEVDEQNPNLRVDEDIPEALEHAVAVVAGKRQRPRLDDPDKSGQPTFVRAVR